MENAEERKKMKKIEKEEQLKKKLEQTMEEKMAADSKTVEGESAVVKAEEGNTATEQEAAPALSEEELNAMYAVSYTHLDVYKRQRMLFYRRKKSRTRRRIRFVCC